MLVLNEHGLLASGGVVSTSLEEVEKTFVLELPISLNRANFFTHLLRYLDEVRATVGESFEYWLDGSFTTSKLNPKDIDVVLFINHPKHHQFSKELDQLREAYKPIIDSYFVPVYPPDHRNCRLYELSRTEWSYVFGTTRDYKNKGFLSLYVA